MCEPVVATEAMGENKVPPEQTQKLIGTIWQTQGHPEFSKDNEVLSTFCSHENPGRK